MSDKHKHRLLLLQTNMSHVLVYPRSPLCATPPSHLISGPSCHALRTMAPPHHHSPSPHPLGWTHALRSAFPCLTPSSGCPFPAISQPPPPPSTCLWLPMLFSPTLVSFLSLWRTAHVSVFSDSSEAKQEWPNQLKKPQARCVVVSCLSAASSASAPTCSWGSPAWPKYSQLSRTLQSHWSGMEMQDVQVCKYWSKKLLEEYKNSGARLEKNTWVPYDTCRFLVLEWLFSHLSKAVKTTDKKKNSKVLNRHFLFFLLSFSGSVLQLHCRATRDQKLSADRKIHPSLTVLQLRMLAESHWVPG